MGLLFLFLTMTRNFFIVANPYSGKSRAQYMLMQLKRRLDTLGFYHSSFITPTGANLNEFIEESLPPNTTDVVVIGGDGTINATLNAVYDKDIVMSFIPVGTGNDFIKMIDIGTNANEYIDTVISGSEKVIDIGECNHRKFINGVGIGFDGQIVHDIIHSKSILHGYAKYYYYVLKIIWSYRSRDFNFEMDGQRLKMRLITMAIHNGTTFGGGFNLNPTSKIDDGLLNVCTIGRMTGLRRFLQLNKLSKGTHGKLDEVNFYQTESIKVEGNDQLISQIDGELFGPPPLTISVLKAAQTIRVRS